MIDKAKTLLELAGKASKRPWEATKCEGDCGKLGKCPKGLMHCDDDCLKCEDWEIYQGAWINGLDWVESGDYSYFTDEDAAYIVAACNNAPALAQAYIEQAEQLAAKDKRIEALEKLAREYMSQSYLEKRLKEIEGTVKP